jgi:hypothetical protein
MAAGIAAGAAPLIAWGSMVGPLANAVEPVPATRNNAIAGLAVAGTKKAWTPPSALGGSFVGAVAPVHDGQWFDRIHVIPRVADLGFMTGDRQITVEVWNAYRRGLVLTSVPVTGPDGVTVEDATCPQNYPSMHTKIWVVDVSVMEGFPVNNVVTWVFLGVSSVGSDLTLTGQRLILFSPKPDGNGVLEESYGYLTDLLRAWDGTEQRILLRSVATRDVRFPVLLGSARESGDLATRLFAGGRGLFSVPLWQDAVPLTQAVAQNESSIYCETTGRAFTEGSVCMLWRDYWHWEPLVVSGVLSDHLDLTSGAAVAWPLAGTICVPLMPARLVDAVPLKHLSGAVAAIDVSFSGEVV